MTDFANPVARRAFVTGLGVGAAALTTGLSACASADEKPQSAPVAGAATPPAHWQPSRDAQDDWMELPGQHRLVFDAVSAKGAKEALDFAANYIRSNEEGYGLKPADLATIVILRHFATPFGYKDAIWAKYGPMFAGLLKYKDPKTKKAPVRNVLMTPDPKAPKEFAVSIPDLVGKGVHFAICGAATTFLAGMIAKKTKAKEADVKAELEAGLIANAHMVPAGIVAVNRAQERGYAFAYVG